MINKKRQELLINNLKSISAEVRQRSLQQLMQIPTIPEEEKREFLQTALQDSDDDVRAYAGALLKEMDGGSGANIATSPIVSPQQIFPVNEQPSVPQFQENPPSAPISPEPQALPSLVPAQDFVELSAPESSLPTMEGIQNFETPVESAVTAPVLNDPVDSSLPDLKKISDIPTLLQHIKELSTNKPSGHLSQLLQLADSFREEVALTALQALLNLKDRRVPPQILFMLSNENYSSQRRFLMLKVIMDTDIVLDSPLLERILLAEKDVIVKSGLVKVFARNCREKGLNTLFTCLQDPDPRVRANTVEVIEEQGIKGCEQHIVQLLQDPENRVKVNAAKFLVKNGYQQAFLTLRSMLVSSEVWLRDSVIFALGEIGDQASLTLLKAALKDPNQGIRLSVLKSLAKINNSTARQVLRAASGDPDPVVAQVANSLWEKVKDTPLRDDVVAPPAMAIPSQQPSMPPAAPVAPALVQPSMPTVAPIAPTPVRPPMPPVAPVAPAPVRPPMPPVAPVAPTPVRPPMPPVVPAAPAPVRPPMPPVPPVAPAPITSSVQQVPANLPEGMPSFSKPRSADIYVKLCSEKVDDWRSAARDIAFVMGDDQMILVEKAYNHSDENVRLSAVKILSRKRTPEAKTILEQMVNDPNELVRSLVEKTLLILK